MLELIEIYHHKQILCMYDNIDDLIESALDTKLLSINSIKSQRLDKKEQEVKNVEEKPAEHTPILSTKEPENSLSMGYEHLSITPETESDKVTESNAKNLLPIPSKCEVTLEDKRECDELVCKNPSTIDVCDNHSEILFDSNKDDLSSDDESFEDIDINRLIANIESLKDNPTPVCVFNSSTSIPILEESDNSLSLPEFESFYDHTEETRSDNTTTHANYFLPEYDSFCFEIEPDQEELFSVVMIDIPDNSSNDPLLEEVDLFLSDDSIPPGIENENLSISRPPPEPPDDNFDLEHE
nr:hypothetical protein [Tanacetum cinerariifolium]